MHQHDLAGDLSVALERNEIRPYFQPIVDLGSSRIVGFEVLARWPHPVRQMIPPAEFIPVAENTGLIGTLTERLLRRRVPRPRDGPERSGFR